MTVYDLWPVLVDIVSQEDASRISTIVANVVTIGTVVKIGTVFSSPAKKHEKVLKTSLSRALSTCAKGRCRLKVAKSFESISSQVAGFPLGMTTAFMPRELFQMLIDKSGVLSGYQDDSCMTAVLDAWGRTVQTCKDTRRQTAVLDARGNKPTGSLELSKVLTQQLRAAIDRDTSLTQTLSYSMVGQAPKPKQFLPEDETEGCVAAGSASSASNWSEPIINHYEFRAVVQALMVIDWCESQLGSPIRCQSLWRSEDLFVDMLAHVADLPRQNAEHALHWLAFTTRVFPNNLPTHYRVYWKDNAPFHRLNTNIVYPAARQYHSRLADWMSSNRCPWQDLGWAALNAIHSSNHTWLKADEWTNTSHVSEEINHRYRRIMVLRGELAKQCEPTFIAAPGKETKLSATDVRRRNKWARNVLELAMASYHSTDNGPNDTGGQIATSTTVAKAKYIIFTRHLANQVIHLYSPDAIYGRHSNHEVYLEALLVDSICGFELGEATTTDWSNGSGAPSISAALEKVAPLSRLRLKFSSLTLEYLFAMKNPDQGIDLDKAWNECDHSFSEMQAAYKQEGADEQLAWINLDLLRLTTYKCYHLRLQTLYSQAHNDLHDCLERIPDEVYAVATDRLGVDIEYAHALAALLELDLMRFGDFSNDDNCLTRLQNIVIPATLPSLFANSTSGINAIEAMVACRDILSGASADWVSAFDAYRSTEKQTSEEWLKRTIDALVGITFALNNRFDIAEEIFASTAELHRVNNENIDEKLMQCNQLYCKWKRTMEANDLATWVKKAKESSMDIEKSLQVPLATKAEAEASEVGKPPYPMLVRTPLVLRHRPIGTVIK